MTTAAPLRTDATRTGAPRRGRLAAARTLALLLAIGVVLGAAKPDLDPSGATWELPAVTFRSKGKAKKLGKATAETQDTATLVLGAEKGDGPTTGAFTLTLDGQDFTGTYTRKNRRSRAARLTFDVPSLLALAELEEQTLEKTLAGEGQSIDLELAVDQAKSKHVVKLKRNKKDGTTTARLRSKVRFIGTASGEGVDFAVARVTLKATGDSTPVDSALVEITED